MRKTLLALSVPFLLCALAHAASFDCTKAKTAQEKAICGTPALSAADDQMAAEYKAWLAAAPPASAAGIRENQLVWLRTRDASCPAGDANNSIASCLSGIYQQRIEELQQMVQHFAGITFVSQAITLTIHDTPDSAPPAGISEVTPGFGTLQATWPQASSTTPQWTAWNSAIVPAVIQVANADEETSAHDWNGIVQPGVDRGLTFTVERANAQWVSATIVDFYDGHGAHPTENSAEFYWMLGAQRALKPEDVFLPTSGWDTWMEQRLDSYLHKALDSGSNGNYQTWFPQGNAATVLMGIVINPADWKLEPAGVSIFFQPYQVACYACTPDPMIIQWSDLKPYLQPSFVLPQ
ncbi:MAG: lysozyme inhibitor LprI family protein [Terracidiphilus sp.]|jgi:uncharacterized protein